MREQSDLKGLNLPKDNAYKMVQEKYDWDKINLGTNFYETVLREYSESFWIHIRRIKERMVVSRISAESKALFEDRKHK